MKRYEVQTLGKNGWINNWTIDGETQYFDRRDIAQDQIDTVCRDYGMPESDYRVIELPSDVGAASMLIDLRDGQITVKHGTAGTVLAKTETTSLGDWERLCKFLRDELGLVWQV